jgi:hypothetical protein
MGRSLLSSFANGASSVPSDCRAGNAGARLFAFRANERIDARERFSGRQEHMRMRAQQEPERAARESTTSSPGAYGDSTDDMHVN